MRKVFLSNQTRINKTNNNKNEVYLHLNLKYTAIIILNKMTVISVFVVVSNNTLLHWHSNTTTITNDIKV